MLLRWPAVGDVESPGTKALLSKTVRLDIYMYVLKGHGSDEKVVASTNRTPLRHVRDLLKTDA